MQNHSKFNTLHIDHKDIFISPDPSHGVKRGQYTLEGADVLLNDIHALFGYPSSRRLGRWLGISDPSMIYKWGKKYRISSLYLARAIHLITIIKTQNININDYDYVEWDTDRQQRTLQAKLGRRNGFEEHQSMGESSLSKLQGWELKGFNTEQLNQESGFE